MPITFNSTGGFLNGTISSSNGDLFITTSGSAGQITIGNLKLSGSVIEHLDNAGVVRKKETFNDDGSVQIQEFSPTSIISTITKTSAGTETIQSASATSNQIVFEQTTNRAKLILSGSTEPLIAVIDAGGSQPYGSNIRAKSFLISSASGVMMQGLTTDGKYGFRNSTSLGSSSDTDFFIDSDGKVNFNKGIVTTQITSSIITSSIVLTEGSNIFGDTISDTHLFNGHITASGNISSSGFLASEEIFTRHISAVGNLTASDNVKFGNQSNVDTHTIIGKTSFEGNITASGNISSSGIISTNTLENVTSINSDTDSLGVVNLQDGTVTVRPSNNASQGLQLFGGTVGSAFPFINTDTMTGLLLKVANTEVVEIQSGRFKVTGNITSSGNISASNFCEKFIQMTNSSSITDTFNTGSFRSAKYILQVTSASKFQTSEMLVLHHNSTASNTEYAQINSDTNLVDFSTDVNGANVRLIASSSFISCSVKYNRIIISS